MIGLDEVQQKLATFDAEEHPEAFWDLLIAEAVERVDAAFALVLLQPEDGDYFVYPDSEAFADLDESPTFEAAIEAVGSNGPARGTDASDMPEPVYSLAVPIRVEGDVAGALAVERYEGGAFSDDDVATLEALTAVFGPALLRFFE